MLELENLSIARPDGQTVIAAPEAVRIGHGVTLLASSNAAGATTLCRTISGRLDAGWRRAGTVSWGEIDLHRLASADLAGVMGVVIADDAQRTMRMRPRGVETVEQLVAAQARARVRRSRVADVTHETLDALGIAELAQQSAWRLARSQRWTLALAQALVGRPPLVVLDSVLAHLHPDTVDQLVARLREYAVQGVTILWAENLIEPVAEIADRVLEIHAGVLGLSGVEGWVPRGHPPETMQLAMGLGLPRRVWPHPDDINRALHDSGDAPVMATRQRRRRQPEIRPTHPPIEVSGDDIALDGGEMRIDPGDRIGVLVPDPDLARRVVTRLAACLEAPSVARAEAALSGTTLQGAFRAWDRDYPGADEIYRALLGPDVSLTQGRLRPESLSSSQRMAVRIAMLLAGGGPAVLTDPVLAMDASMRERLIDEINHPKNAGRAIVIVATSPELVVRACDRIVEVAGTRIIQDAGPIFAQRSESCRTFLSRACWPPAVTTLSEALDLYRGAR